MLDIYNLDLLVYSCRAYLPTYRLSEHPVPLSVVSQKVQIES
jgi:hypothetical protein